MTENKQPDEVDESDLFEPTEDEPAAPNPYRGEATQEDFEDVEGTDA